jgi:hypothetical protein
MNGKFLNVSLISKRLALPTAALGNIVMMCQIMFKSKHLHTATPRAATGQNREPVKRAATGWIQPMIRIL